MTERKKGRGLRVMLITVIVIAAAVFIIDRVSWADWNGKCSRQVSEYMASGNYASALAVIKSQPQAFKDSALRDECVEGLPEQFAAIASGEKFTESSTGSSCWSTNEIKKLYAEYGGDTAVLESLEPVEHITEAAGYLEKGQPGNAGNELLKLPEEDKYAADRVFGQACKELASVLSSVTVERSQNYHIDAEKLDRITGQIPDAAGFAEMFRALDGGDIETAWTLANGIPFDGTREHPIPDSCRKGIFKTALKGGMKNAPLTPAMLKLARELFAREEGESLSDIVNYSYTHRATLKINNLTDAGKAPAGKVLILNHDKQVQLEMMALLDDAYYPDSIEEVSTVIYWDGGFSTEGYYGGEAGREAKREWFTIVTENTADGTKTEKKLWADPVPESQSVIQYGYVSRLKLKDEEAFLTDFFKQYSWMK